MGGGEGDEKEGESRGIVTLCPVNVGADVNLTCSQLFKNNLKETFLVLLDSTAILIGVIYCPSSQLHLFEMKGMRHSPDLLLHDRCTGSTCSLIYQEKRTTNVIL